jgi:parallel beta-helix repeat protein
VRVATREPVVIENATIRSRGHLIEAPGEADLTVRNTVGVGLNPNDSGRYVGRFLWARHFRRVVIENCTLDHTAGIYLYGYKGDHSPGQTFKILRNRSRNIDGRYSDGKGGYQEKAYLVQFFQTHALHDLGGGEVAWNQMINEPGKSAVEDNINLFDTTGTAASPVMIHDNYVQGAYPANPLATEYSGGGILLSDYGSAYVVAHDNQVVSTTNYGIAISSGHDNRIYNNRVVSAGRLPDGRPIPAQNVGVYIWNMKTRGTTGDDTFARNGGHGNVVGWAKGEGMNHWWTPDAEAGLWKENQMMAGPITAETEAGEWKLWQEKVKRAGVRVGAEGR